MIVFFLLLFRPTMTVTTKQTAFPYYAGLGQRTKMVSNSCAAFGEYFVLSLLYPAQSRAYIKVQLSETKSRMIKNRAIVSDLNLTYIEFGSSPCIEYDATLSFEPLSHKMC